MPWHISSYVSIKGNKQGQFKGNAGPNTDKIGGLQFNFGARSPRNAATGQASGKRPMEPLSITKELALATPQIYEAFATNEVRNPVLVEFVKISPQGQDYVYYTITLTNAAVSSVRQFVDLGLKQAAGATSTLLETVTFTFQKIEMEDKDGKTSAVDNWSQA